MGSRKNTRDAADRLCSILENLDGTPAEDLRSILLNLSPNADEEEQGFIQHVLSVRRKLEASTEAESLQPNSGELALKGLISEARNCGLSIGDLADATGLSPTLVKVLDMRLARYATIPAQVVEDLATIIKRSIEQVALYLQGGPVRTAVAYSDQDQTEPGPFEQRDFFDLVRTDTTLSEEHRARLLELGSR
jgi:hypothetical protein